MEQMCSAVTVLRNGERHVCGQYATADSDLCAYHKPMKEGMLEPAPIRPEDDTGVDYVLRVFDDSIRGFEIIYTYIPPDPDKEGLCPESEIATEIPKDAVFATA